MRHRLPRILLGLILHIAFTLSLLTTTSVVGLADPASLLVPKAEATNKADCPVLSYCVTPDIEPYGLTWDGSHFWVASGYQNNLIQRLDPSDCTVVHSIPAPSNGTLGLAWDGTYLWAAIEGNGLLYQLDPSDGTVISEIPAPSPAGMYGAAGLACDGNYLWHADYRLDRLYQINPVNGDVVNSYPPPHSHSGGLGYRESDGTLILSDFNSHLIYTIDPSDGSVLDSCTAPGTYSWGITVANDHVWLVDRDANDLFDLDDLIDVAVEKVSWGYLRAIYR
jgi:streptogramin lyase